MFKNFEKLVISDIYLAMHVPPNTGHHVHNRRKNYGLVMNTKGRKAKYIFSDGYVLNTEEYDLFYLPKNSSYKVTVIEQGDGCFAINFDFLNDINEPPFLIDLQNNADSIFKNFNKAASAFTKSSESSLLEIMRNLYDIFIMFKKEHQKKSYLPNRKKTLIQPALDKMKTDFLQKDLSVKKLSEVCGISETYFRRIFTSYFGISPKEYIINRRIDYAKKLLLNIELSVTDVTELCGFTEPCHFSREFSKRTGLSPSKYKEKNIAQIES